jgi:hypothetical protein
MLLYENELNKKLRTVEDLAESLVRMLAKRQQQQDFIPRNAPIDVDALSAVLAGIEGAVADLMSSLPKPVAKASHMSQHLSYARYYLEKSDWNGVLGNARDIAEYDLTNVKQAFYDWSDTSVNFDEEFRAGISDLLVHQQLDSAARKAFVILKGRLVNVACVLGGDRVDMDRMDGNDLVGWIFGADKLVAAHSGMTRGDCQALMYLLQGLYGTFRNIVDHNDVVVPWHETEAVISMINWALLKLTAIAQTVHDGGDEAEKPG